MGELILIGIIYVIWLVSIWYLSRQEAVQKAVLKDKADPELESGQWNDDCFGFGCPIDWTRNPHGRYSDRD